MAGLLADFRHRGGLPQRTAQQAAECKQVWPVFVGMLAAFVLQPPFAAGQHTQAQWIGQDVRIGKQLAHQTMMGTADIGIQAGGLDHQVGVERAYLAGRGRRQGQLQGVANQLDRLAAELDNVPEFDSADDA